MATGPLGHQVKTQGLVIFMCMLEFAANELVPDDTDNNMLGDDRGMGIIKGKCDFQFVVLLDRVSADDCKAYAAHGDILDEHGALFVVKREVDKLAIKICIFAVHFPQFQADRIGFLAGAFYLDSFFLVLQLGDRNSPGMPAMRAFENCGPVFSDKGFLGFHQSDIQRVFFKKLTICIKLKKRKMQQSVFIKVCSV